MYMKGRYGIFKFFSMFLNFLSATVSHNPSNKIHLTRIIILRIDLRNFNHIKLYLGANIRLRGSLLPIYWQRLLRNPHIPLDGRTSSSVIGAIFLLKVYRILSARKNF